MRLFLLLGLIITVRAASRPLEAYFRGLPSFWLRGFGRTTAAPPTTPFVEINGQPSSTPAPFISNNLQSTSVPISENSGLLSDERPNYLNNLQIYGNNFHGNLLYNGFESTTSAPPSSVFELNRESVSTPAPFENDDLQSSSLPFNINNGLYGLGSDFSNNLQGYGQNINSNLLNGFGSTTSAPPSSFFDLNKESISTPAPFENDFQSSSIPLDLNSGLLSRFGSDNLNIQQGLNTNGFFPNEEAVSSTTPGSIDFSRLFLQNNIRPQSVQKQIPDVNPINVQSRTSGGSIYDAFGINDEAFESQSERPAITKNVYFFTAPEEEEVVKPRVFFEAPKKHVNVVYIKAPAAPSIGPIEITPPKQESAEKTVVYVLVKKPEQQKIIVKPGPTAKPANPDVFFINYKNDEEAQQALEELQSKEGAQGGSDLIQEHNLEEDFVRANLDVNHFKRKASDKKVRRQNPKMF